MKTIIDIHNHTIASGHAFSTVQEMAHAAAEKGIEYLGITDHGPAVPGTCDPVYFRNYPCVPREMYGVKLLMGCEVNILNAKGEIDIDDFHFRFMDICIAGIHRQCWTASMKHENTDGVLRVMHNPCVNVIAHPGDGTANLDFEPLVKTSRDTGTLLEINSASLKPYRKKTSAKSNNLEILRLCKKYDVPVILSADAHISFDIANYVYALPLLEEADFPEELVLNDKPEAFFAYTGVIWNHKKYESDIYSL